MSSQQYSGPVCRGSWAFGNNCGHCEKCVATRPQFVSDQIPGTSSALVVPDYIKIVAEHVRDKNPRLFRRLSIHDLRTITEPLAEEIAALRAQLEAKGGE